MSDSISRDAAIAELKQRLDGDYVDAYDYLEYLKQMPSAEPEQDWSYDNDTKEITLIVPEDVYDSVKIIFLSVGYEGQLGLRGMVYSSQPERKKGEWIDETFKPWGLVHHPFKCDLCSEHSETDSNYCPNCGADMRGEKDG